MGRLKVINKRIKCNILIKIEEKLKRLSPYISFLLFSKMAVATLIASLQTNFVQRPPNSLVPYTTSTPRPLFLKLSRDSHNLTTGMNVIHHLFLQSTNVLFQFVHDSAQFAILALEHFDLVLEPGNTFELAPAAFGGGNAVPLPFSFEFDPFLILHVDW